MIPPGFRHQLPIADRDATPQILDVGFSNTVIRFGATVARVARTQDAARGHGREAETVNVVAGRLPVDVPGPFRLLPPQPEMPYGAALVPWLPGDPMTAGAGRDPAVVALIAETLDEVHRVPAPTFPPDALLRLDPLPEIERLEGQTTPWLRTKLSDRLLRRLQSRWTDSRTILPGRQQVVCHADAWFGNMLTSGGRFSALLDWEDACVADPALDLAAQLHLEGDAGRAVIAEYVRLRDPFDDVHERIECYRLIREAAGLAYLLRNGIDEELNDAATKIASLLD